MKIPSFHKPSFTGISNAAIDLVNDLERESPGNGVVAAGDG
jgi:hypothetical protein